MSQAQIVALILHPACGTVLHPSADGSCLSCADAPARLRQLAMVVDDAVCYTVARSCAVLEQQGDDTIGVLEGTFECA